MGEIKVSIPDEDEKKFRKIAMETFGHRRGSISKAARKALVEWADKMGSEDLELSGNLGDFLLEKDPNTDRSAVELQENMGEAYQDEVLD